MSLNPASEPDPFVGLSDHRTSSLATIGPVRYTNYTCLYIVVIWRPYADSSLICVQRGDSGDMLPPGSVDDIFKDQIHGAFVGVLHVGDNVSLNVHFRVSPGIDIFKDVLQDSFWQRIHVRQTDDL